MTLLYFITHPDVLIDPNVAVPDWALSPRGRDRMQAMLAQPWVPTLGAVWCSTERKAIDGATIIADAIGTIPHLLAALGENDRSSTGYLPKAEFEATADAFFAHPHDSVQGWETAIDAQRRIVTAIATVLAEAPANQDIAVMSHGGVGTLLLCYLKQRMISRTEDQPDTNGGNYYCFDIDIYLLRHGWAPIDVIQ
ncbi:histidine phosphatase family protein [Acidisphaera sp. S103]|uniref:histidine phosphatase family protein n=1 Tax=Acidisphaera sp. S103 TaxID=1747223 RepID=UPI00131E5105|nr:histidine phosphatase family protein [Acidisphaera sp. S103]